MSSLLAKLFGRHLLATNVSLSVGLSGLGDVIQQKLERQEEGRGESLDYTRTLHMSACFGLTSGLLCHYWYLFLDRAISGRSGKQLVKKVLADQLAFSPLCILSCLCVAGVLERSTPEKIKLEVIQKGSRLYLAEFLIWPPAQLFNFRFLPTRFRVLFDNLVSLGFDVYTSHVKHRIPLKEEMLLKLSAP